LQNVVMVYRHITAELATVTLICILALFLFPAASGSFVSTHGPVSTFRAMRAANLAFAVLETAAFRVLCVDARSTFGGDFLAGVPAVCQLSGNNKDNVLRC
jgi:hypothetical protein